ncbi:hypothetical protein L0666_04065 [Octadecabacter sp. CECT 8868]|uniref:hypothetical protein n=1 Tax=Octadecabacter algicola TaxID=2909342 RepID=UPI001F1EBDD7|nr:hypothetical protein [Octadecabacter algicola]MCF2904153.1 hypothetical protein [Octadecabacter algicola]
MYRPLMSVVGIFAALLGLVLVFAPLLYLSLYVPDATPDMAFAAQRLSPVVVGLGALIWAARGLSAGPVASTLCLIGAGVWGGVAATGVFHYLSGTAGFSILIAAFSELVLGLLFFIASRQMRHG